MFAGLVNTVPGLVFYVIRVAALVKSVNYAVTSDAAEQPASLFLTYPEVEHAVHLLSDLAN